MTGSQSWRDFSTCNRWFSEAGWRGGIKLVFKGSWSMHKWEGRVQTQLLYCGRLSTQTLGFRVWCRVVFVLSFAQISSALLSPPPPHPPSLLSSPSSNVLAKLYIASSCCVILNQWALILLLKHCGSYWKKKPMTFKAVCFLRGGGWEGEWGVLCLCLSLYFEKKKH